MGIVIRVLSSIAPTFTRRELKQPADVALVGELRTYLYSEGSGLVAKVGGLQDSQLKDLQDDGLIKVLDDFYDVSGQDATRDAFMARARFDVLLVFLQSPYIDKKLTALNEIKKLFDRRSRAGAAASAKATAGWLADSDIIDYIYKEAKHPELISRSADLLCILADFGKLSPATLDMIWET